MILIIQLIITIIISELMSILRSILRSISSNNKKYETIINLKDIHYDTLFEWYVWACDITDTLTGLRHIAEVRRKQTQGKVKT